MRTIYKYPLRIVDRQLVQLPANAAMLSVGIQKDKLENDQVCLWAEIEDTNPLEWRTFHIYGTGHPIYAGTTHAIKYIATFQLDGFVGHVYEVLS